MTDSSIEKRKFTDQEVHEILKRAVDNSPARALAKTEGFSLSDLQAIGADVGIDPARLEDAARSVVQEAGHRPNRFVGAPTVLSAQRRVHGVLDPGDTPEVLSVIRHTMGRQGEVSEIHGSLEWRVSGESGTRYVTLSEKDGTSIVRASANLTNLALITYLPAGLVGLVVSVAGLVDFAQDGELWGLVLFFTLLPAMYGGLRTIMRKASNSVSAKVQRVVDEVARLVEEREGT